MSMLPTPKALRPVGRPARVTIDAIFDAALEIGLDKVTMKGVADRLDVGISTLYQYVRNRDELVRLAALRQASMRRPPRHAAHHWAEVAMRYAEDLLQLLIDEPQMIVELMRGGMGPRTEAEILERFLSEMQQYGFTPIEAFHFYRSLAMVTIGAAVGALNYASARARGNSHETEVKEIFVGRDDDELPLLRIAANEYAREDMQLWFKPLHELIAGIASARGETLSPNLLADLPTTLVIDKAPSLSKTDNLGIPFTIETTTTQRQPRRK